MTNPAIETKIFIMMNFDMVLSELEAECMKRFGASSQEVKRIICALMSVS